MTLESIPHVAVLLPAFNAMTYVAPQVESILNQLGVAVELYVSIDRSVDGTSTWFEALVDRDPRVHLLKSGVADPKGAAANVYSMFTAMDFRGFTHVALADQDDVWFPDHVARGCAKVSATAASGYSSDVIAFWPDGRERLVRKSQRQVRWDHLFSSPGPGCSFVLSTDVASAFAHRLAAQNELAQSIVNHDWLIYAFVRSAGDPWIIDSRPGTPLQTTCSECHRGQSWPSGRKKQMGEDD